MRNTLLIQLLDPATEGCRWMSFDGAGTGSAVREGDLLQAAQGSTGLRVVVLVPADALLLADARIPTRSRQRALKAVPNVLEEQLAAEIDALHFALGPHQEDDTYPVAVVDRARVESWLGRLEEVGLQPDHLVPDLLALPREDDWVLWSDGELVRVRTGDYAGFVCDQENLDVLLECAAEDGIVPPLRCCGDCESLPLPSGLEMSRESGDILTHFGSALQAGAPLDLLQGEFSRSAQWARIWKPWRATAALLVGAIVLAAVSMGVQYYRMGEEQQVLQAQIESLYRQAFPRAKRVVNPKAQMEQELRSLRRGSGGGKSSFLALVERAGPLITGAEGIEVRAASYREGRLDLDLTARNLQVLDQLKQSLSQVAGLTSEIESATADADQKVKSRLRIIGVES